MGGREKYKIVYFNIVYMYTKWCGRRRIDYITCLYIGHLLKKTQQLVIDIAPEEENHMAEGYW